MVIQVLTLLLLYLREIIYLKANTQFYPVTLRHALRKGRVTSKEKLAHSEYSEKNNNKMSYLP